jgi:L-galactose dehydrogenase/L-glyceraldehyde 3-phosphate reductase
MAMEMRVFGRTGMQLSVLGFGCGAVGGLMVRGDALDQERAIARAIAAGVNYFDTAVQYGNGESEKNLGRVLHNLKASDVVVLRSGWRARTSTALKMLWRRPWKAA